MKYKIHMVFPDEHKGYKEVRGYPVSSSELKGIELFAHRPHTSSVFPDFTSWVISEKRTGLSLLDPCVGTKEQALDALNSKILSIKEKHNVPDMSKWMTNIIKDYIAEYGEVNKEV